MKGSPVLLLAGLGALVAVGLMVSRSSTAAPSAPSPEPSPAPEPGPSPVTACSALQDKIRKSAAAEVVTLRQMCGSAPDLACTPIRNAIDQAEALESQLAGCAPGETREPCASGWAAVGKLSAESALSIQLACGDNTSPVCAELAQFKTVAGQLTEKWIQMCAPPAQASTPIKEIGAQYTSQPSEGIRTIVEYLATRKASL